MADTSVIRGADDLQRKLWQFVQRFPAAQGRMLFQAGEAIRAYMVDNFLSGQRLRRITGRLAGGFSTVLVGDDTAIVGTQVVYARPLEFGFSGPVAVREFSRSRTRGGPQEIKVRAHIRNMNVRARHYARDAAVQGAPDAIRAAEAVVRKAIREAGLGD